MRQSDIQVLRSRAETPELSGHENAKNDFNSQSSSSMLSVQTPFFKRLH